MANGQSNVNPASSSSQSPANPASHHFTNPFGTLSRPEQPQGKVVAAPASSSPSTVNPANGQTTNRFGAPLQSEEHLIAGTPTRSLFDPPAHAGSNNGPGSGTSNIFEGNTEASRPMSISGSLGATDTATANITYTLHQPDRSSAITVPVKSWITTLLWNMQNTPDGKVFTNVLGSSLYAHATKRTPNHHQLKNEAPMSLYGIQNSLRCTGYGACTGYKNISAIISDFDLIVLNTIECAGADDPMTHAARRLRLDFENRLNGGMPQPTISAPGNKRPHPDSELPSGSTTVDGQPSATKQKTSNT